ncbi:MAG: hypothetical protein ACO1NK_05645 [Sediminibacterium sp.]
MKLREIDIDLTGFMECSIENNIVICSGFSMSPNAPDADIADLYIFNVINPKTNSITEVILVAFKQVGEGIQFLYRKLVFDVVSITDDLITLKRDGIDYFIKRINYALG